MARQSPIRDRPWAERLSRSGYFFGAVLLHLIVFMMIATIVIFPPFKPPTEDFQKTYVQASAPHPPPPPMAQPEVEMPTRAISAPSTPIIAPSLTAPAFTIPMPSIPSPAAQTGALPHTTPPKTETKQSSISPERLAQIKATVLAHRDLHNLLDSGGDPKNVVATFPVYLASYAKGDWGCNIHIDPKTGKIDSGSLPNLVAKMNEWSKGRLTGAMMPTGLQIGTPELLDKKPPFIFFTGHANFILTEQEVQNLRDYLQIGGCIWGDNALPGRGSDFDVAFRREMKRVVPDLDKNFEPLPLTADIFTKSWFPLSQLPQGMNFYAEPVEHLDIDGKLAILYTPNDYSDMFTMRILPGDTQMGLAYMTRKATSPLVTNALFLGNRGIFFRNYELPSCLACDQFAMNVIGHLLVRFDKDLLLTP